MNQLNQNQVNNIDFTNWFNNPYWENFTNEEKNATYAFVHGDNNFDSTHAWNAINGWIDDIDHNLVQGSHPSLEWLDDWLHDLSNL